MNLKPRHHRSSFRAGGVSDRTFFDGGGPGSLMHADPWWHLVPVKKRWVKCLTGPGSKTLPFLYRFFTTFHFFPVVKFGRSMGLLIIFAGRKAKRSRSD